MEGPPEWFAGEQSCPCSYQQREANQGCGQFMRAFCGRRGLFTWATTDVWEASTYSGAGRIGVALQPPEICAQLRRSLAPQLAVLLQSLVEDRLQLRRQPGFSWTGDARHLVQNRFKDDCGRGSRERLPARRHLIQHDAEREQIGALHPAVSPRACSGDM